MTRRATLVIGTWALLHAGPAHPASPGFEPNLGQAPAELSFVSRGPGAAAGFARDGVLLRTAGDAGRVLRLGFPGALPAARIEGLDPLPGVVNDLRGSDPECWNRGIPTFARLRYTGLYPGVEAEFYWTSRGLEYDLLLAPEVDARKLVLSIDPGEPLRIDEAGDLWIGESFRQLRPRVRERDSGRVVDCRYELRGRGRVGFDLGRRSPGTALVIDPEIVWSSPLGGTGNDLSLAVQIDAAGDLYLLGRTDSSDFPTLGPYQSALAGGRDLVVTKLDPTGATLIYSTYLGGGGEEDPRDLSVNAAGEVAVVCRSTSTDFPTQAAFQGAPGGGYDAVLAVLDANGASLLYSTYLGGSADEDAGGVDIDATGAAVIAGRTTSADFPLVSPYSSTTGTVAFMARFDGSGTPVFSTLFGSGSPNTYGEDVVYDGSGILLVGESGDIPTVNPFQAANRGGLDGFLSRFDLTGQSLLYSSYFGGSQNDLILHVAVDPAGEIFLGGLSGSDDLPLANAFQPVFGGSLDSFVARLDAAGQTLRFSSYLGGSGRDDIYGMAVSLAGEVVVVGESASPGDFPIRFPLPHSGPLEKQPEFLAGIDTGLGELLYSSFIWGEMWGAASDPSSGDLLVAGYAATNGFPLVNPSRSYQGATDAILARIKVSLDGSLAASTTTYRSTDPVSYSIRVENPLRRTARGVATIDFFTDPCIDTSGFDPSSFPTQVTATAPINVNWNRGASRLDVSFIADFAPDEAHVITITGLAAGAPSLACPHSTSIIHQSDPNGIVRRTDVQVEGCPVPPAPATGLRAARAGSNVALVWDRATDTATAAYHIWRLLNRDKRLLPLVGRPLAAAEPGYVRAACGGSQPLGTEACTDNLSATVVPSLVCYQVRGACGDSTEGMSHPF